MRAYKGMEALLALQTKTNIPPKMREHRVRQMKKATKIPTHHRRGSPEQHQMPTLEGQMPGNQKKGYPKNEKIGPY